MESTSGWDGGLLPGVLGQILASVDFVRTESACLGTVSRHSNQFQLYNIQFAVMSFGFSDVIYHMLDGFATFFTTSATGFIFYCDGGRP